MKNLSILEERIELVKRKETSLKELIGKVNSLPPGKYKRRYASVAFSKLNTVRNQLIKLESN